MTPQQRENAEAAVGLATAWGSAGVAKFFEDPFNTLNIHSWSDAAAAAATTYTVMLIIYFVVRRLLWPIWKKWKGHAITPADFGETEPAKPPRIGHE